MLYKSHSPYQTVKLSLSGSELEGTDSEKWKEKRVCILGNLDKSR